ncbi:MAG: hypothetical protein AB1441_00895 [Bacillota bacterium]
MPLAEFPNDGSKLIRFRCGGAWCVVTEREMIKLLAHDPVLWVEAIRRGKAILRREQAKQRKERS